MNRKTAIAIAIDAIERQMQLLAFEANCYRADPNPSMKASYDKYMRYDAAIKTLNEIAKGKQLPLM